MKPNARGGVDKTSSSEVLAASMRQHGTGRPLTCDELAAFLRVRMERATDERQSLLEPGEAVAGLLNAGSIGHLEAVEAEAVPHEASSSRVTPTNPGAGRRRRCAPLIRPALGIGVKRS